MIQPWTDDLIFFLNELARIDPAALRALIEHRVPCSEELAEHSTVQVDGAGPTVGMLGILNGFCGAIEEGERAGWGPVAACFEDDGSLSFRRTDSATILSPPTERSQE